MALNGLYFIFQVITITGILFICSCATPSYQNLTSADHKYAHDEAEKKLIERSNILHNEIFQKGLIYKNDHIQKYINDIGCRLIPPGLNSHIRFNFFVIKESYVNAFAMPNGNIYITIPLLSRLENEMQLAQVLSHELSHIILRHGIESFQSRKSKMITAHITDIALLGTSIAYLPFAVSIASYSRDQEVEADKFSIELLSKAGYNVKNADKLFTILSEVKNIESVNNSLYSSHPSNQFRKQYISELIKNSVCTEISDNRPGSKQYKSIMDQICFEYIKLKLFARHYELSLNFIEKSLENSPDCDQLHYYLGKTYLSIGDDPKGAAKEHNWLHNKKNTKEVIQDFTKKKDEFYQKAEDAFNQSLTINQDCFLAHRGKGIIAFRRNDYDTSRKELKQYLLHEDKIKDRRYINNIIEKMEKKNETAVDTN